MVFFNYALRKLNAKIVYYGPGLCGKTTNLQWIHDHFEGGQRGKMISLATEGDRTIFFDLLPIDIGTIRGMDVTLQLYTVPGQVHYNSTRQLVLRGADGVVFVADSQRTMRSSNAESFENLQENLMLQGIDLKEFPHVLQFNKRDLRDLSSIEDLNENLNVFSVPIFEAIATEGIGVQETLEGIVKLVMRNLRERYEPVAQATGPQVPAPPMQSGRPSTLRAATSSAGRVDPLAPDFVSQAEPPAQVVRPSPGETQKVGPDLGFAAFRDEDGVPTAVYEETDQDIAAFEAALEGVGSEVELTAGDEHQQPIEPDRFDGLFNDPRDENGSHDSGLPHRFSTAEKSDDAEILEESDAEIEFVQESPSSDLDFVAASAEPVADEAGLEDLFHHETPSVGDFVRDTMKEPSDDVELIDEALTGGEDEIPRVVVAPSPRDRGPDRYEDRIEAPGPFAPPPVREDRELAGATFEPEAEAGPEHEVISDEVRQAFGAAEDREALASLWATDSSLPEAEPDFVEGSPEVTQETPPIHEPEPVREAEAVDQLEAFEEPAPVAPSFAGEDLSFVDEATPTTFEPEPAEEAEEPSLVETAAVVPPGPEPALPDRRPKSQPIMVGVGDPFADLNGGAVVPEVLPRRGTMVPSRSTFEVRAEDNQLHLQLRGSGAIAEMGQVRALDIEVPVPGHWVGNRKVTLQLRLTLTPAEDEDD